MKRELDTKFDRDRIFSFANILVSVGIILVTSGGSWDISNHILNKPETFFSPPHAILYSGVGVTLVGFIALFVSGKKSGLVQEFGRGIKIITGGIVLLLSAGPIDFAWHSRFGLDGLLSPPHLALICGMALTSIGALVNTKSLSAKLEKPNRIAIILAMIPVWLSITGLLHSFSLPFSKTDYFDFNPDPVFGAVFASVAYPFLISTVLVLSSILSKNRFGVSSIVGMSYLLIMTLTAIIPNHVLIPTIPFFAINIIPILLGDFVLSRPNLSHRIRLAGAVTGSAFYFMYYPLITYTYNEVTVHKLMWPSLTPIIYFEMVPIVVPILVVCGAVSGVFGAEFAKKISSQDFSKFSNK